MVAISQTMFINGFLEWKYLNLNENFTEVCSYGSIRQYVSIDSGNGLAPIREQAIILSMLTQFTDAYIQH